MMSSVVSTQYTSVTDGRTDTAPQQRPRYAYASRGKTCEYDKSANRQRIYNVFRVSFTFSMHMLRVLSCPTSVNRQLGHVFYIQQNPIKLFTMTTFPNIANIYTNNHA